MCWRPRQFWRRIAAALFRKTRLRTTTRSPPSRNDDPWVCVRLNGKAGPEAQPLSATPFKTQEF